MALIFSADRRFVLRGDVCVCGVCIPRPGGSASAIATFLSRAIVGLFGGQGRVGTGRRGLEAGFLAGFHDSTVLQKYYREA